MGTVKHNNLLNDSSNSISYRVEGLAKQVEYVPFSVVIKRSGPLDGQLTGLSHQRLAAVLCSITFRAAPACFGRRDS
ncbi:unnamed protein product [Litomosoides sigmodontis]|uniref:Uncharacterized protein n=1 Tax=Litomosoides sigmodontis TaxID=42156 RepID=A0A3P6U1E6_LITSI|nr:unnamed protein product [Litomosoides sigmodontis]